MSPRRLENLDPQRQRTLFEAAAEEFAAKGFDRASLNRILEKSGMSKSSLYYYFDDKGDLFATLLEQSITILFRQAGGFDLDALTSRTFWTALAAHYRKMIALVSGNGWLVKFGGMFYGLRADPKQGAHTGRVFQAARHWVGLVIQRGQALGAVRSDLPDSLLIDSTMGLLESLDRWTVAHWDDMTEDERQALPAVHIGLFRDLLSPRPNA